MKIGNTKVTVTVKTSKIYSYNCAMATLSTLSVRDSSGSYVDYTKYSKDVLLELAKEFLVWLKTPEENVTQGMEWSKYGKDIVFFVFHDNIKSQGDVPLHDMSSWLQFIYENQEELKCRVIQTPMVDNLWHQPQGSHPGRVFVLIPPYARIYEQGSIVSKEELERLNDLDKKPKYYYNKLTKEDKETIRSLRVDNDRPATPLTKSPVRLNIDLDGQVC